MPDRRQRLAVRLTGVVQGVGFRPFVHRLAGRWSLPGWVRNFPGGVELEVEGPEAVLAEFLLCLEKDRPEHAVIYGMEPRWLAAVGMAGFEIRESGAAAAGFPVILPDLAPCPDCLREIRTPGERRYGYPFTNCTHCGPRYTIIEGIPYDRSRTGMKKFSLCPDCAREYSDPADRRFHAQPIACPACGPELYLLDETGSEEDRGRDAESVMRMLDRAAGMLREGGILALMGVGGVQLLVDARNEETVLRLRKRKNREAKPLALMAPDVEAVRSVAEVGPLEERLLRSPESPIVLLKKTMPDMSGVAASVAGFSPWQGVMLPSSPLHALLMDVCKGVLVVTSGNRSGEPMCVTREEALRQLSGIADMYLFHTRPIVRPVDDSVVRVVCGREMVVRRARGYAPLPLMGRTCSPQDGISEDVGIWAAGGQLKNTQAFCEKGRCVLSQHLGDMETGTAFRAYLKTREDLSLLLKAAPGVFAVDSHPDYTASVWARQEAGRRGIPVVEVQHHVAHVLGCMEENEVAFPALGVAWDGTGYGPDGSVWGGEFFLMEEKRWKRIAHWLPFRLPGNELAVRHPGRVALGLLSRMEKGQCPGLERRVEETFPAKSRELMEKILEKGMNSSWTSSMGRLFDAMAFMLGFDGENLCEGQAAMTLEGWGWRGREGWGKAEELPLPVLEGDGRLLLDWRPLFVGADRLRSRGYSREQVACLFHAALARIVVTLAVRFGMKRIAAGGGCFQNGLLLELLSAAAKEAELEFFFPQRAPSHDGGLALGQVSAVLHHYQPE